MKNEYESLTAKLQELSDDELSEVTGGGFGDLWEKMKTIGEKTNQQASEPPAAPIGPFNTGKYVKSADME